MIDTDIIPEEAPAWSAIHRLGLSIGCDHAYGRDGVNATETCIQSAIYGNNQYWTFDLHGWPWFGFGKLTLLFRDTGNTYTYWAVFITRKLSLAIHIGGKSKGGVS